MEDILDFSLFETFLVFHFVTNFIYRNKLSASVADGTSNVRAIQFGSRLQHYVLTIDPTGLIGLADLLSSGADGTFRLCSLPERPGCLCCITQKR